VRNLSGSSVQDQWRSKVDTSYWINNINEQHPSKWHTGQTYTLSKCRIEDENPKGNNPFGPANSTAKARSKRIKCPKKMIVPLLTRLSRAVPAPNPNFTLIGAK
jgi:hypothetical protein